jgi:hypothetical protein
MSRDEASSSPATLAIEVECYAGYRGEQTPRAISVASQRIEIAEVLDQWLAPNHRYFKLRGVDGHIYLVRHDVAGDVWELTLYQR